MHAARAHGIVGKEGPMPLDQFRRVADTVIAPNAARADATGELPPENMKALNELGANMLFIPDAFGGSLRFDAKPGAGCTVSAEFPMSDAARTLLS